MDAQVPGREPWPGCQPPDGVDGTDGVVGVLVLGFSILDGCLLLG